MKSVRLSVIIPTRNRPQSLTRVLQSIAAQTLEPTTFEVVVVDDGSDPPVDAARLIERFRFSIRVQRRIGKPGAHESRCSGSHAAVGERVLFLDDDVVLTASVLADHAAVQNDFAIGPIKYDPEAICTPFQRYQAIRYASYANSVIDGPERISASELYICNASGPRKVFSEVLDGVCATAGGAPVGGDGCDEVLMDYQLATRGCFAQILVDALVLHIDTKTVKHARGERYQNGMTVCRLLLEMPELRSTIPPYREIVSILTGGAGLYRMWKVRLVWVAPRFGHWIAECMTAVADRGPARLVPAWVCYLPLAIAFWDGMRKIAPSYAALRAALFDQDGHK